MYRFICLTLVIAAYSGSALQRPTTAGEKDGLPTYLEFDQAPSAGWRALAEKKQYIEAARTIEDYLQKKRGLLHWQRANLNFHAGQMYAFAGRTDAAIARFKRALLDPEPPNSPIRWNAYVRATIAFLVKDRKSLESARAEIARGRRINGIVPNLDVVDRLLRHFGKSYAEAYRGK